MTAAKNGSYWQLRLERGEDIPSALASFVAKHGIKSGVLIGLGAAETIVLGYFHLQSRKYRQRTFAGDYEIASIVGNVAWDGKVPVCHLHAVISGPQMNAYAGHLFSARVAATCEVSLFPGRRKLQRRIDSLTGLKLLQLART